MGYRSDVAVVITVERKESFELILNELNAMELVKKYGSISDNGVDGICIKWESIKWYTGFMGYDEINAFVKWLSKEAEEENISYHFIRIGEDVSDIEEKVEGEPLYWAYVERSITTGF